MQRIKKQRKFNAQASKSKETHRCLFILNSTTNAKMKLTNSMTFSMDFFGVLCTDRAEHYARTFGLVKGARDDREVDGSG